MKQSAGSDGGRLAERWSMFFSPTAAPASHINRELYGGNRFRNGARLTLLSLHFKHFSLSTHANVHACTLTTVRNSMPDQQRCTVHSGLLHTKQKNKETKKMNKEWRMRANEAEEEV